MHETYRILAQHQIDERLREAADWRLADAARSARPRRALVSRVLALVSHVGDQRREPAPTAAALTNDCVGCA